MPGGGQLAGLADRLRVADGRPAVTLPPVVTPAAHRAGTLRRQILGVDDEARSAAVGDVLRPGTVAALAADVDLVGLGIVVDVHLAAGIVDGSHEELARRLVLISLPARQVTARAHRLHGVGVDRRRRQRVVGACRIGRLRRPTTTCRTCSRARRAAPGAAGCHDRSCCSAARCTSPAGQPTPGAPTRCSAGRARPRRRAA